MTDKVYMSRKGVVKFGIAVSVFGAIGSYLLTAMYDASTLGSAISAGACVIIVLGTTVCNCRSITKYNSR